MTFNGRRWYWHAARFTTGEKLAPHFKWPKFQLRIYDRLKSKVVYQLTIR